MRILKTYPLGTLKSLIYYHHFSLKLVSSHGDFFLKILSSFPSFHFLPSTFSTAPPY